MEKIVIRPSRGWSSINLKEIWDYRELLYFLVWREIKVRYKQTLLGAAWAIIQPLSMMIVFTLFFGKFVKVPHSNVPYPLFSYSALLPWMLFSEGLGRSAQSVIVDGRIINKVYFPRLILPVSGVITPLVDFVFAFAVFLGIMFYYGVVPDARIIFLPLFVGLALITSMAAGFWLSAINVQYRDVRYTIPFLTQLWFFASPVVYSSASMPKSWQFFYSLNPMVGVIEGFRWVLLGTEPPGHMIVASTAITLIVLILGAFYYRKTEKTFADVV